jgi:hypothetical protein
MGSSQSGSIATVAAPGANRARRRLPQRRAKPASNRRRQGRRPPTAICGRQIRRRGLPKKKQRRVGGRGGRLPPTAAFAISAQQPALRPGSAPEYRPPSNPAIFASRGAERRPVDSSRRRPRRTLRGDKERMPTIDRATGAALQAHGPPNQTAIAPRPPSDCESEYLNDNNDISSHFAKQGANGKSSNARANIEVQTMSPLIVVATFRRRL